MKEETYCSHRPSNSNSRQQQIKLEPMRTAATVATAAMMINDLAKNFTHTQIMRCGTRCLKHISNQIMTNEPFHVLIDYLYNCYLMSVNSISCYAMLNEESFNAFETFTFDWCRWNIYACNLQIVCVATISVFTNTLEKKERHWLRAFALGIRIRTEADCQVAADLLNVLAFVVWCGLK